MKIRFNEDSFRFTPVKILIFIIIFMFTDLVMVPVSIAQQEVPEKPARELSTLTDEQVAQLEDEVARLCADKSYDEALGVLLKILTARPRDSMALYNAACVQAQLGQLEKSVALLHEAVLAGFVNFEHMKQDPDLDPIRTHKDYVALLEIIKESYENAAEFMEQWSAEVLGKDAIIERDDKNRFVYATNLGRETYTRMRKTIDRQFAWQIKNLFDKMPSAYVLLMVPTPEKADSIIQSARVGGYYDHDLRRLVTRDLGPSLTHELTHTLHHAQMDRIGQKHPMWIQEGLASIFEMYEIDSDGNLKVLDNSRINIVINLGNAAALTSWEDLFTIDDKKFTTIRPRAKYSEARAVFQFVCETAPGGLGRWYKTYIETFNEDSTGIAAFEKVYENNIKQIERQYRLWLKTKEKVPERVAEGKPAIGIWVADQTANDGVGIVSVHPGGAAKKAGLRSRDIILAIDDKPVYAVEEILYEVLKRTEGDEVTLKIRRGKLEREIILKLRPVTHIRNVDPINEPGISV